MTKKSSDEETNYDLYKDGVHVESLDQDEYEDLPSDSNESD